MSEDGMKYTHNQPSNCFRVPPSRFVVNVYSSSLPHNCADPQGNGDFLSGFTLLAFSSPSSLALPRLPTQSSGFNSCRWYHLLSYLADETSDYISGIF
uniref:Uncharacterized protein n=1 Tax=Arion vulgaris TaxID=1028688 RepID=A0A0B7AMA1_9EUPU